MPYSFIQLTHSYQTALLNYIYASPWEWSILTKEFTAVTRIMQSSSNELSTLVSGKAKMQTNKSDYVMPINFRADAVRLLAERYDTKSNVKLGGFQSQHPMCLATLKSCDTTKQSI